MDVDFHAIYRLYTPWPVAGCTEPSGHGYREYRVKRIDPKEPIYRPGVQISVAGVCCMQRFFVEYNQAPVEKVNIMRLKCRNRAMMAMRIMGRRNGQIEMPVFNP